MAVSDQHRTIEQRRKTMKNVMTWAMFHATHWAVLYGAFLLEIEGAMYVLKFFVWAILLLLATALLSDELAKKAAKNEPRPLRRAMSLLQSWATLCLLVWYGHIATAIAWALGMAMEAVHRERVLKFRADAQTA